MLDCPSAALPLRCSQEELGASAPPPAHWALRSWACFSAHALFLVHMVALAAVLGAWTARSLAQLGAAIGIKAAWTLWVGMVLLGVGGRGLAHFCSGTGHPLGACQHSLLAPVLSGVGKAWRGEPRGQHASTQSTAAACHVASQPCAWGGLLLRRLKPQSSCSARIAQSSCSAHRFVVSVRPFASPAALVIEGVISTGHLLLLVLLLVHQHGLPAPAPSPLAFGSAVLLLLMVSRDGWILPGPLSHPCGHALVPSGCSSPPIPTYQS